MTIDSKAASECSGKCGFILFPSLFPGSPGSGGRVGPLDTELSEQGGAQVPVSVPPHPQCPGPEQGKSCLFFCLLQAPPVMGFGVPGLLKDTGLPLCSRILRGVCVPVACTSTPEVVLLSGV